MHQPRDQGGIRRHMEATELFENAMDWLRQHYDEYRFYLERDIVWTVQVKLIDEVLENDLPYTIFSDYSLSQGNLIDLVILADDGAPIVAAEFKYEPSEGRRFFARIHRGQNSWTAPKGRFTVDKRTMIGSRFRTVAWVNVTKDVERARHYANRRIVRTAYSIFIDEGGSRRFQGKTPPPGSEWRDWGERRRVLWSKFTDGET